MLLSVHNKQVRKMLIKAALGAQELQSKLAHYVNKNQFASPNSLNTLLLKLLPLKNAHSTLEWCCTVSFTSVKHAYSALDIPLILWLPIYEKRICCARLIVYDYPVF